jgi:hypothetical protein
VRPYLKNTLYKKGLMEWLKVKALSSNPSTTHIKILHREEKELHKIRAHETRNFTRRIGNEN